MHQPYTYFIKHIPTGLCYYGVRYAKECHPNDLWTTYFTSSHRVRALIEEYGKDSFLYEIRRTFEDAVAARNWERRVLTRLNVLNKSWWMNRNIAGALIWTDDLRKQVSDKMRGREKSPETKEKLRRCFKGKPLSLDHRKKLSVAKRGRVLTHLMTEEVREKRRLRMVGRRPEAAIAAMIKKVTDGDQIYASATDCARQHGLHVETVYRRIKRGYRGWAYL